MRLLICSIAIALSMTSLSARSDDTVSAPWGWEDQRVGDTRVVDNGNTTITIGSWQSLQGASAEQWLSGLENNAPDGAVILSSEGVKPERLDGAYAVNRKVQFADQTGYSVLYACPGQPGHARLLSMDVKDGSMVDMLRGAMFGEKVCEKEHKGKGSDTTADATVDTQKTESEQTSVAQQASTKDEDVSESAPISRETASTVSDEELRALNQQIPKANRPVSAHTVITQNWVGFPAMLMHTPVMVLEFPDDTQLACSDWDPAGSASAQSLNNAKGCDFSEEKTSKIVGFKPGDRLELAFGRISASGIDGIDGSASSIGGGNLLMTNDGRIVVGRWQVNHIGVEAASGRATSTRRQALVGRYYVDGYTITIVSEEGEVIHGFIGHEKKVNGVPRGIFLNGERYWDRKK